MIRNDKAHWGLVTRSLHWLMALMVLQIGRAHV